MKKVFITFFSFIILFGLLSLKVNVSAEVLESSEIVDVINSDYNTSKSSILIEAKTNKVLVENNSNVRLHMASMTKVMSLLLFFEALDEGRLKSDQMITTSANAASKGGSQIFLEVGEQMTVDDLLKSICIASANDATVALAEAISGSEEAFVKMMNDKVKALGLSNTNYANSTGLPSAGTHYTTAYDMAIISSYLINNYPTVLDYTSRYEDYVRKGTPKQFWLVNTNKMVKNIPGVDGLKTGWTDTAGYCLTCTKEENGMRLISVVMGCKNVGIRTTATMELLNYGFSNYEYQVILKKDTVLKETNNILMNPSVQHIVLADEFGVVVEKGKEIKDYQTKIEIYQDKINNYETIDIGKVYFYSDGAIIGEVSLNILEKTEKVKFFDLFKEVLKAIFY